MTSVDNEGTLKGFDDNLVKEICKNISLPVIVSGGFGKPEHIVNPVKKFGAMQLQLLTVFTITNLVREIRDFALNKNIKVRKFNQ